MELTLVLQPGSFGNSSFAGSVANDNITVDGSRMQTVRRGALAPSVPTQTCTRRPEHSRPPHIPLQVSTARIAALAGCQ